MAILRDISLGRFQATGKSTESALNVDTIIPQSSYGSGSPAGRKTGYPTIIPSQTPQKKKNGK